MTGSKATALIARREIVERARGRATRVMTVVSALLVVAAIVLPAVIKGSSKPTRIGLVGTRAQALALALERTAAAAKVRIAVRDVVSDALARAEVKGGRLDVAVALSGAGAAVEVKQSLSPTIRAVVSAAVDKAHFREALAQAGVPEARVLPALAPVPLRVSQLEASPPDKTARSVAAIAAGLLMYLALSLYGTAVANGVAQEKTSRTAEVLLGAVRPSQLLTGKVLGIGLVGLTQLAVTAVAALVANALVHSTKVPSSVWVLLPTFLVYFVAGFVLYAFAFAAAGALVARQEEVQSVSFPLGMPILIGYLLVYVAIGSPNATWLRVVSFLPPLMASLMPARIALGHVALWEFAADAAIMAAAITAMIRLAARVYAGSLIRGGPRLTWRQALGRR